jgi:Galactose oxidase, central domain
MTESRIDHTATLLKDGRVLICGGYGGHFESLNTAEVYEPGEGFSPVPAMLPVSAVQSSQSALLLSDGRVLLASVCRTQSEPFETLCGELFDPSRQAFTSARLVEATFSTAGILWYKAVALNDGNALIVSNFGEYGAVRAERYDPRTNSTERLGVQLHVQAPYFGLVGLDDGRILILGRSQSASRTALRARVEMAGEMYSPKSDSLSSVDALKISAEVFETSNLYLFAREGGSPGLGEGIMESRVYVRKLPDGRVLLVFGLPRSVLVYDPRSDTLSRLPDIDWESDEIPRYWHFVVILRNGSVLISDDQRGRCAIWDPLTGRITTTGSMLTPRKRYAATLLADGKVLITGGIAGPTEVLSSAEIYDPATGQFSDH